MFVRTVQFEVEKPLGLTFGPKSGKEGGVIIKVRL
jgi:hypothetical protein